MGTSCLLLFIHIVAKIVPVLAHGSGCDQCIQRAIYVDSKDGTSESVCWTGGEKQPCSSVDLALEGARQLNSTVVIPANHNDTNLEHLSPDSDNLTSCSSWYFQNGSQCECGSGLNGLVHCDPKTDNVLVLQGYCMTYDNDMGREVVGACLYNFLRKSKPYLSNYHRLPLNTSELNEAMCGHFNRQGQLCGQCMNGYYLPVYSYDLHCRNCTHTTYNWAKYVFAAFGPLTIFLLIILLFRISVTSPPLVTFVVLSQINSAPLIARLLLVTTEENATANMAVRVITSVYGIWNLDFFRTLLPPICMELTTLQVLALDYAIAFYPMVVIIITYFFNEMYEQDYRVIRWLWKPFQRCCARFRKQWDVKNTLIDAFATFFSLSVVKFLNVSFYILIPIHLFDIHGQENHTAYLLTDATVQYFDKQHLPYAIIACLVFIMIVMLPFLLFLFYQCWCFQRCLSYFRLRSHALHTFINAFQGSLKDGTNGTWDCRYFAAANLGIELLLYILYSFILNVYFWSVAPVVFILISICYSVIQPYKLAADNTVAAGMFLILALYCILEVAILTVATSAPIYLHFSLILLGVLGILPQLYITGIFIHWLVCKKKVPQMVLRKFHIWKARSSAYVDFEELLPDRLANPEEYENMFPNPLEEENQNEDIVSNTAY